MRQIYATMVTSIGDRAILRENRKIWLKNLEAAQTQVNVNETIIQSTPPLQGIKTKKKGFSLFVVYLILCEIYHFMMLNNFEGLLLEVIKPTYFCQK